MATSGTVHTPGPPHIAVRPEWLARQREAPLEPGLPIIDAHHHLWQFPEKTYRSADLLADMRDGHNVVSTVFVECKTHYRADGQPDLRSVGEMEFVVAESAVAADLQPGSGICGAAIGYADLRLGPAVIPVLDALIAASCGRLRGVRNIAVWHADPTVRVSAANPPQGLMSDPAFREGFAALAEKGLVFDAWLIHTQLDELHALASAFPDVQVVLNHVGGPLAVGPYAGRRAQVFEEWRAGMARLAESGNVAVKLGGFGMPLFGFGFERLPSPPDSLQIAASIGPYVGACIDLFGAQRCMFESNFPVDKGCFNYNTLWNAFKRLSARHAAGDIEALFFDTAARIYRMPAAGAGIGWPEQRGNG